MGTNIRSELLWANKRGVPAIDVIVEFAFKCSLQDLNEAIDKEIFRVSDPRGISDSYEDWLRRAQNEVNEVLSMVGEKEQKYDALV
jgi:hypothetical protein